MLLSRIQREGLKFSKDRGIKHIFAYNAPNNPIAQAAELVWAYVKRRAAQKNEHGRQKEDLYGHVQVSKMHE